MVATVIAIIALLILPIFRQRTEEARKVAAQDELSSIAKAMLLVEADTGIQCRLNDLDNGEGTGAVTNEDVATVPPIAAWNATLESADQPKARDVVVAGWLGPYASFERYALMTSVSGVSNRLNPFYYIENGGPIYHVTAANAYSGPSSASVAITDTDESPVPSDPLGLADRYPVDPWGQPYLFFGKGLLQHGATTESTFNSSVAYSMGPDGLPGDGTLNPSPSIALYQRESGVLGTGDDYQYRF